MKLVAVALSGGADSLMSLLLARESGAAVLGVHARFADHEDASLHERLNSLCAERGVPFQILDLRAAFEEQVILPFIHAHQHGLTPNPCAHCNKTMKFGLLWEAIKALGATHLATGHYARLEEHPHGPRLFRGLDPVKDQSYFLSRVPRACFQNVLFPLGEWTKERVKAALTQRGLCPPVRQESQEICFIPTDYREFLQRRDLPLGPAGPITLADGTLLGRHDGLWAYTLGQRKGLGIAYSEPLYVTAKDFPGNRLVVGPMNMTLATSCRTDAPNLLCTPQNWPDTLLVQTIYRQQPEPALVRLHTSGMYILFARPCSRPTPGQIATVYAPSGRVLAAGMIISGEDDAK